MARIDHPRDEAHRLQRSERALQVHARALHDHHLRRDLECPLRQGAPVTLEGAELSLDHLQPSIVILDQRARGDLGLVNIQRHHALVHRCQLKQSSLLW